MAMMAMTTRSSMRVKAGFLLREINVAVDISFIQFELAIILPFASSDCKLRSRSRLSYVYVGVQAKSATEHDIQLLLLLLCARSLAQAHR